MNARPRSVTAADSLIPVAITNPRAAPSRFSFSLRFTIRQWMILTAVAGLAMDPLAMIRKHDRIELIVAMVAFEFIGLPALITIILMSTMKPGPSRLKTIVILSLLPTLLAFTAVGLFYLVGFPFFLNQVASDFVAGDFRHLPVLGLIVWQLLFWSPRFLARCPECQRRGLRLMRSPPSTGGRWAVIYECQDCKTRSGRNVFKFFARTRRLVETETTMISATAGLEDPPH